MKQLFSNLQAIKSMHFDLKNELQAECAVLNMSTKISHILLKYSPFFKLYFHYFSNYEMQTKAIDHLKKNNVFFKTLLVDF